jgi:dethiobiotin synthetase
MTDLISRARALAASGDFLLVEGAGGLLVPYAPRVTAADLAAQLGLPVLVVARTALGTINHTALTLSELARRGIPLAGVVLVQTTSTSEPHERFNPELIEEVTAIRPLGTLPYLDGPAPGDPDRLADALARALDPSTIDRLLG